MIALYFPELALELLEWTESLAMLIAFPQVDNAAGFRLPADNFDGHAVVITEPPVKFVHSCAAASSRQSPTAHSANSWVTISRSPGTLTA